MKRETDIRIDKERDRETDIGIDKERDRYRNK